MAIPLYFPSLELTACLGNCCRTDHPQLQLEGHSRAVRAVHSSPALGEQADISEVCSGRSIRWDTALSHPGEFITLNLFHSSTCHRSQCERPPSAWMHFPWDNVEARVTDSRFHTGCREASRTAIPAYHQLLPPLIQ